MNSKFLKDLPEMVQQGVITKEVESSIRSWYQEKTKDKPNRLLLVLGVLGALLVGLGIILILAHNWDNFPKITKTVLAFIPLLSSQALVMYTLKRENEVWLESSGTLLFFSVGTAISLISQVYHIPGNLDSFLLTWILLCAPLVYLLKSKALTLLHLVFITWWAVSSGYGYRSEVPWYYLLLFVWVIPFYKKLFYAYKDSNMAAILSWVLPLSFTIVLGTFTESNESVAFLMYVLFFGVLYLWGTSKHFQNKSLMQNGFMVLGLLGTIISLLITSFKDVWKEIASEEISLGIEMYTVFGLLALLILLFIEHLRKKQKLVFIKTIPLLFTIIFFAGFFNEALATIIINILTLFLGIILIREGARNVSFKKLNLGLLIITVLIACRFFDTDLSFVFRGVLFLVVGLGFFLANYFIIKRNSKKHETE